MCNIHVFKHESHEANAFKTEKFQENFILLFMYHF